MSANRLFKEDLENTVVSDAVRKFRALDDAIRAVEDDPDSVAIHEHASDPMVRRAAGELIRLDDTGLATDIVEVGRPFDAMQNLSRRLLAHGMGHQIARAAIAALESYTSANAADFSRKFNAKPLYARVIVSDRAPEVPEECQLVSMTQINGERVLADDASNVVMNYTIHGTRMSMSRQKNLEQIAQAGRRKDVWIVYGTIDAKDLHKFETADDMAMALVEAVGMPAASGAGGASLREAIADGSMPPKAAELVQAVAEINRTAEASRTPGAVADADAKISALKNTIVALTDAVSREGGIPPALVKAVAASFDKTSLSVATPETVAQAIRTGALNDNQTNAPLAKIEKTADAAVRGERVQENASAVLDVVAHSVAVSQSPAGQVVQPAALRGEGVPAAASISAPTSPQTAEGLKGEVVVPVAAERTVVASPAAPNAAPSAPAATALQAAEPAAVPVMPTQAAEGLKSAVAAHGVGTASSVISNVVLSAPQGDAGAPLSSPVKAMAVSNTTSAPGMPQRTVTGADAKASVPQASPAGMAGIFVAPTQTAFMPSAPSVRTYAAQSAPQQASTGGIVSAPKAVMPPVAVSAVRAPAPPIPPTVTAMQTGRPATPPPSAPSQQEASVATRPVQAALSAPVSQTPGISPAPVQKPTAAQPQSRDAVSAPTRPAAQTIVKDAAVTVPKAGTDAARTFIERGTAAVNTAPPIAKPLQEMREPVILAQQTVTNRLQPIQGSTAPTRVETTIQPSILTRQTPANIHANDDSRARPETAPRTRVAESVPADVQSVRQEAPRPPNERIAQTMQTVSESVDSNRSYVNAALKQTEVNFVDRGPEKVFEKPVQPNPDASRVELKKEFNTVCPTTGRPCDNGSCDTCPAAARMQSVVASFSP